MQNYVQPGHVVEFTAPSGGVTAGLGYQIGSIFCVAISDAAQDDPFQAHTVGVFDLVKATGAWTEGQLLYWDDSAKKVTGTAASNALVGVAARDQDSGDTTGRVRLNGTASDSGAVGNVGTADIADGAVTAAKAAVFFSDEITATGSSQNVAHGLGVVPAGIMPCITEHPGTPDTGAFDYAPGTHTTTNIVFTATVNTKWRFFAWA